MIMGFMYEPLKEFRENLIKNRLLPSGKNNSRLNLLSQCQSSVTSNSEEEMNKDTRGKMKIYDRNHNSLYNGSICLKNKK